ncbi:MAG: RagB/SusD family nutrient uptake outer membrane protein [Prevotella sp.]|nr:RagB/SusD family nutrient uptake outer membrane protein [Prevotella sp.]
MKAKLLSILLAGATALTFTSCDDYFDDVPDNATSLEAVFANRGQSLKWLSNIYTYIPDNTNVRYNSRTNGNWPMASIEGYLPWDHIVANNIILGTLYPSTDFVKTQWTEYYRGIQYANIYLANIDKNSAMLADEREWSKAEVHALRAYFYFNLVKEFGPVPLIGDKVYSVDTPLDEMMMPRNTLDECWDYIIAELKAALDGGKLKSTFGEDGSVDSQYKGNLTQEAVEGILAEVYLYRASYLFNGDPYYQTMANKDGTKLFPQSKDMQKWKDARDAAKRIIDSGKFKLVLRDQSGKLVDDVKKADPYKSCFYSAIGRVDNEEMIFLRTNANNDSYIIKPRHTGISGNVDRGAGAYSIPLQFIDLFFMSNGKRIDDVEQQPISQVTTFKADDPVYPVYDTQNLTTKDKDGNDIAMNARNSLSTTKYVDRFSSYNYFTPGSGKGIMKQFYCREPRFYLAVTFQNRRWDYDQANTYYTDMSFNGNSGSDGKTHDYPIFGTIVRKLYWEKESNIDGAVMLRLGEVYLNYAEACAQLGESKEALKYVNLIRSRAGINEYALNRTEEGTKDARNKNKIYVGELDKDQELLLKVIYRERLIELSYESKHYFDVRRWGVADMAEGDGWVYPTWHKGGEGGDMIGFNVNNEGSDAEKTNSLNFYKRVKTQHRIFTKRMSLFPIPQEEVNRDKQIVQNEGWAAE